MTKTSLVARKIVTIARAAEIAALIGMVLIAAVIFYAVYFLFGNGGLADAHIVKQYLKDGTQADFTSSQRLVGVMFALASDCLGLLGLYTARRLFAGYQRGDVFTALAATRLKLIGWVVVLLAPVSQLAQTAGILYFTQIVTPGRMRVDVSIEDSDVYAIVFGLLIVVVGYVMYEAVRISDENESFV